ncbi:hypothetical protein EJ629_19875 [Salmonella enterica]|nr:hypothetical protein [Salmonella enterica]EHI3538426.1 hypothetical protein [Salmonella enterica]
MAIHDAGMFTVKGINRLKILQDAIDRKIHQPSYRRPCTGELIQNALFPVKRYDKQAQFFYVTAP